MSVHYQTHTKKTEWNCSYIYIYYIDTDIYARFFSCEKPFRDMFLTNVIQSES